MLYFLVHHFYLLIESYRFVKSVWLVHKATAGLVLIVLGSSVNWTHIKCRGRCDLVKLKQTSLLSALLP